MGLLANYRLSDLLVLGTILLISFSGSLTAAVRYGFLADSFARKGLEPLYYGLIGGSMFGGFLLCYLTRITEVLLRRFTPKALLQVDQILNLLYPLGCILSYQYQTDIPALIGVNIALRVFNGFLGYPRCLLLIDLTRSQFSRDFDSVNSIIQLGVYAGHGLGAASGSALYDNFGYNAPFYLVAAMLILPITLTALLVPDCPSHRNMVESLHDFEELVAKEELSEELDVEKRSILGKEPERRSILGKEPVAYGSVAHGSTAEPAPPPKLSFLVILPLLSTMLVNIVYGYLQISITPYLVLFHVSISSAGLVLTTVSIGMMLGSLASAFLMQGPRISPYTQMSIGSILVGVGIILMFPARSMTWLFENTTSIAYLAALLAGAGDPLITIASLAAMKEVQTRRSGGITPEQEITIGGTWLIGFLAFCFLGQAMAGFILEYLTHFGGALILAGMSLVSLLISFTLSIVFRTNVS